MVKSVLFSFVGDLRGVSSSYLLAHCLTVLSIKLLPSLVRIIFVFAVCGPIFFQFILLETHLKREQKICTVNVVNDRIPFFFQLFAHAFANTNTIEFDDEVACDTHEKDQNIFNVNGICN